MSSCFVSLPGFLTQDIISQCWGSALEPKTFWLGPCLWLPGLPHSHCWSGCLPVAPGQAPPRPKVEPFPLAGDWEWGWKRQPQHLSACPLSLLCPQHFLTALGGLVAVPLILAKDLCLQHDPLTQSYLISTIFFVSGICTLLQVFLGVR